MAEVIAWWSGGVTSAVACKMAIDQHGAVPVYIETGAHHTDFPRFQAACEKWYGVPITTLQSDRYKDHIDVILKDKYVNGPTGARCTLVLKRRIREKWEATRDISAYVWGFEKGAKEGHRADRIKLTVPGYTHLFPLQDAGLTKEDCFNVLTQQGIAIPEMYLLGFSNNNCVGCVKGGGAYWNKIRIHFPEVFDRMAKAERVIGRSCLKKYFLDELPTTYGRGKPPLVKDCGAVGEGCLTETSREFHNRE